VVVLAKIAIIDDDLAMEILTESLRYRGHDSERLASAAEALEQIDRLVSADLIVLDIIMPWPPSMERRELAGSRSSGMEILREIRARKKELPVIAFSVTQDAEVISALSDDKYTTFVSKWDAHSVRELVITIEKVLGIEGAMARLVPFIVHGRNDSAKLELKNYLQNTLHLPEPIVLHEQPELGRTIIEKFEDYAAQSSLVFVLLTPDDVAAAARDPDETKRRARQNVIFEMGYFLGLLGRRSGRVLLLHEGPLEIPSDLSGVVYIDISRGVEAAGERIRREVQNVK